MKTGCLILSSVIIVSIIAVCVMVKFATEIQVDDKYKEDYTAHSIYEFKKSLGVISLSQKHNVDNIVISDRFPYVAAITANTSRIWSFSCFGSVILIKWVVTAAHCWSKDSTHRILVYSDFVKNYSRTYHVQYWKVHPQFNLHAESPRYDIALAKLTLPDGQPLSMKMSTFDESPVTKIIASVWKTVSTMDKRLYLTNDFEQFDVNIVPKLKCFEGFGLHLSDSEFCVDMSQHEDCFIFEFGPVYSGDKVAGLLAMKPRECDMKIAIFTNVSYYSSWILKTTKSANYG